MTKSSHPSPVCRLAVRVQPRASKNEVAGTQGEAVKIRLTAPPVEGKANEALLRFLADALKVSRASLALAQGEHGRNKVILIQGLDLAEVWRKLGVG